MDLFYIVDQVWIDPNGNFGAQAFIYKDETGELPADARAKSKFHDILKTGAISADLYHGASVKRSDGMMIKPFEFYDRRPVQQNNT